jgi:4-oxalocrotonate tautomerase
MPLVKVWLREPVDDVRTGSILDGIHAALVSEANVPSDDRFQVVERLSESTMIAHPSYGGVERSEQIVFVEITLNRGRSVEVKKRLYAAIARNLEQAPGIRSDDLLISLVEVEKENWSFGKGIATYAE